MAANWQKFTNNPISIKNLEIVNMVVPSSGIANEEPDYITDPVYSRYQDMSPWQDAVTAGHTKMDQVNNRYPIIEL